MIKSTIRHAQLAKLMHKELSMLFLTKSASLLGHALISVTAVRIAGDGSNAKVYLSFSLHENQEMVLKRVVYHTNTIKRLLGQQIAHKMRKIPDLKFYIDHTIAHGARVTALIDQLNPSMELNR